MLFYASLNNIASLKKILGSRTGSATGSQTSEHETACFSLNAFDVQIFALQGDQSRHLAGERAH